ncbi:hypothetical protein F5051DRAFT_443271 [Lentinula edodes]|nr:hypothetical protein F5051DRAFT_443271 [Lentinula edodes]
MDPEDDDNNENDDELQTPFALSSIPTSADPYVQSKAQAPFPSQYLLQLFLTSTPPLPPCTSPHSTPFPPLPPPNNPVSSSPQPPSKPMLTHYNWTFYHSKTLPAWEQNPQLLLTRAQDPKLISSYSPRLAPKMNYPPQS